MSHRSFRRDERAIEGLPIRLVIAVVVGIASLGVMMSTISGLGGLGVDEVDARPTPDVIQPEPTDLTVAVVDSTGKPVANATVIAKSGTARLPELVTAETGFNGTTTLSLTPSLGANQQEGTLRLEVKPPSGQFADRRGNTPVLVVRN